jgi:hypothetical protein
MQQFLWFSSLLSYVNFCYFSKSRIQKKKTNNKCSFFLLTLSRSRVEALGRRPEAAQREQEEEVKARPTPPLSFPRGMFSPCWQPNRFFAS